MSKPYYRPQEFDEVRGPLNSVEVIEEGCLALIGKIPVLLPSELACRLQGLLGRHVGVLRLEGYYVKEVTDNA